jgi:predicted transcriptional regulator
VSETTFTFRVETTLKDQFTKAAKSRDRTGAQLLRDFMRDFVRQQQEVAEHDAWFRRQVQAGIDAANAGDVISAEQVEAEASAWRAETRRKIAQADHPAPSKS